MASGNPRFEKDDLVVGVITWGEYSVVKEGTILNKLDSMGFPETYHLGVLGNKLLLYHHYYPINYYF